jgi:hypothetical protein
MVKWRREIVVSDEILDDSTVGIEQVDGSIVRGGNLGGEKLRGMVDNE